MIDADAQLPGLAALTEPVAGAFERALAASEFVRRQLGVDTTEQVAWVNAGGLSRPWGAQEVCAGLEAQLGGGERPFSARLRDARNRQMARIAVRALSGWAPLAETLAATSAVAECCLAAAYEHARGLLESRFGIPRAEDGGVAALVVFGMGKLGGGELNFSSDIDLIFGYTAEGETDGRTRLANGEYFARLAQETCRLLSERTADGFVFRCDLLLRPFGRSGAVAMSLAGLEQYYQVHGRDWERYAWIKARAVAGDLQAGEDFITRLRGFVYRRYLDFDAISALRELKQKIAGEVSRQEREDDIKLGAGGIREIEFVVQAFQLIRGGQEPALRERRLAVALHALESSGHLPAAAASTLRRGYDFLRRLENALQMYADEQTHRLPRERTARDALCTAMEATDWDALMVVVNATRRGVQAVFADVFAQEEPAVLDESLQRGLALAWSDQPDLAQAELAFAGAGFRNEAAQLAQSVQSLRTRARHNANEATQRRVGELVAAVLSECAGLDDPDAAAVRTLQVVERIAGRSTYLSLLLQYPTARHLLVRCCGASPWIAQLLASAPALLDALLYPDELTPPDDPGRLREELEAEFARHDAADTEMTMEVLRRFKQENALAVAIAQLDGRLTVTRAADCLSACAEAILELALARAWAPLAQACGVPPGAQAATPRVAIVGYGKLGAHEMGYTSDLDVVILFEAEDADAATTGGGRSLSVGEFYQRLAQRVVQLLTALTARGRAYEIDLALRPSGNSGLVTSRMQSFERYQRESAWTWEHQALTRARVVAGDPAVARAFGAIRRQILERPREAARLRADVLQMRERLDKAQRRRGGEWDTKLAPGGLVDVEFIAQYLVLAHAPAHPELVDPTSTIFQLDALQAAGLVDARACRTLSRCARLYRAWQNRRALQGLDRLAQDSQFRVARARVRDLWRQFLETP